MHQESVGDYMKKFTSFQGFIMLMVVMLALVLLTGSSFFYYMLFLMIITIISMFLLITRNSQKILQYMHLEENEITVGDEIHLDVKSNNNSMFPVAHVRISCRIYNNHNEIKIPSENIFLNPYQIVNIRNRFIVKTRGLFTMSSLVTEYSDPLKFFSRKKVAKDNLQLVVYPYIEELDYFYIPSTGYMGTKKISRSGYEDYSSLKKIRPYTQGDSFKKIHWKVSSKRGEMFVKEYDSTSSSKMTIFLDAFSNHYLEDTNRAVEDRVVEIGASIAKYALKENSDTSLIYHDDKIVQVDGRDLAAFPNIMKELVTFIGKGNMSFSELVNQETKRLVQGAYIVLITPRITEGLINTLMGLKRKSFIVSLIVVKNGHKEETYHMLRGMGIRIYRLTPEDNLKEKLEGIS